jgi:hypothetical protein
MDKTTHANPGKPDRPSWSRLAKRFGSESDCLAAFIALETAEVLAGAKPAALVGIPDRPHACGLNLYQLWREHGPGVMERTCLTAREIGKDTGFIQLLFYIADDYSRFLGRRDVTSLLRKAGYRDPFKTDQALNQLEERIQAGSFPHEIGIFLGYPIKDVAAFMGWIKLPFACQGPWKMFGNPRTSLRLAETFRACRRSMAEQLAAAQSALDCIVKTPTSDPPLFLQIN